MYLEKKEEAFKIASKTCQMVDFAVMADYRVKLKESEKWNKYLDLASELENYGLWCQL